MLEKGNLVNFVSDKYKLHGKQGIILEPILSVEQVIDDEDFKERKTFKNGVYLFKIEKGIVTKKNKSEIEAEDGYKKYIIKNLSRINLEIMSLNEVKKENPELSEEINTEINKLAQKKINKDFSKNIKNRFKMEIKNGR